MATQTSKINVQVGYSIDKQSYNQLYKDLTKLTRITQSDLMNVNQGMNTAQAAQGVRSVATAAKELQNILSRSYNYDLGTINVAKFNKELQKSPLTLQEIYQNMQLAGAQGAVAFQKVATGVLNTNTQLKETHSLLEKMATTFANTVRWQITTAAINTVTNSVQQAYNFTKRLDSSLNDIRIVTGKSAEEMDRFADKANRAAKALGASTTDYTNAALIYYQQGLSDQETAARTETTLKAANVTGQSTSAVSEELTAVWNGFQITADRTEATVDKLAAVAASSAANLEELSTAMSKTASAAHTMGVDVDQLNAILATVVSITRQAPETVGTAYRTIFSRLGDIKAGIDDDTTLDRYTQQLKDIAGISVLDLNNELRDTGKVIEEIGEKWSTFSREQQITIAQAVGGTRQYSNVLALFNNWDMYQDLLKTSIQATGTLQKQQDTYMDSVESHIEQLRTSMEGLQKNILDADTVNAVVDGLATAATWAARLVKTMGGGSGGLTAILGIISKTLNQQIATSLAKTARNIQNTFSNKGTNSIVNSVRREFSNLSDNDVNSIVKLREQELRYSSLLTDQEKAYTQEKIRQKSMLLEEVKAQKERVQTARKTLEGMGVKTGSLFAVPSDQSTDVAMRNYEASLEKVFKRITRVAQALEKARTARVKFDEASANAKAGTGTQKTADKSRTGLNQSLNEMVKATSKQELVDTGVISAQTYKEIDTIRKQVMSQLQKGTGNVDEKLERQFVNKINKIFDGMEDRAREAAVVIDEEFVDPARRTSDEVKDMADVIDDDLDALFSGKRIEMVTSGIMSIGTAATQTVSAFQTLSNVADIFTDDTLSSSEKTVQVFSSVGIATTMLAFALGSAKQAMVTFGVAAKTATAATGILGAAVAIIAAGVIAFDALTTSAEEAKENIEKSVDAYKNAKSELESLNSEIKTCQDRLQELYSIAAKDLTITDIREIEKLEQQNALLATRNKLLKENEKQARKDVADAAVTSAKKKSYGGAKLTYTSGYGSGLDAGVTVGDKTYYLPQGTAYSGKIQANDTQGRTQYSLAVDQLLEQLRQDRDANVLNKEMYNALQEAIREVEAQRVDFFENLDAHGLSDKEATPENYNKILDEIIPAILAQEDDPKYTNALVYYQDWIKSYYDKQGTFTTIVEDTLANVIESEEQYNNLVNHIDEILKDGNKNEINASKLIEQIGEDSYKKLKSWADSFGVSIHDILANVTQIEEGYKRLNTVKYSGSEASSAYERQTIAALNSQKAEYDAIQESHDSIKKAIDTLNSNNSLEKLSEDDLKAFNKMLKNTAGLYDATTTASEEWAKVSKKGVEEQIKYLVDLAKADDDYHKKSVDNSKTLAEIQKESYWKILDDFGSHYKEVLAQMAELRKTEETWSTEEEARYKNLELEADALVKKANEYRDLLEEQADFLKSEDWDFVGKSAETSRILDVGTDLVGAGKKTREMTSFLEWDGSNYIVAAENVEALAKIFPELLQEATITSEGLANLDAKIVEKYVEQESKDFENRRSEVIQDIQNRIAEIREQKTLLDPDAQQKEIDALEMEEALMQALWSALYAVNVESTKGIKARERVYQTIKNEADIYHDINLSLEKQAHLLSVLQKRQEKLYGKELIANLNAQNQALKEQAALNEKKAARAEARRVELRNTKGAKFGAVYDSEGYLANYEQMWAQEVKKYNTEIKAAEKLTDSNEATRRKHEIQERFNDFKEFISEYDKIFSMLQELETKQQDITDSIVSNNISKFTMEVELRLDIHSAIKDFNDFQKEIDKRTSQALKDSDYALKDYGSYFTTNQLKSLTDQVYGTINEVSKPSVYGEDRAKALEDLKKYYTKLMTALKGVNSAEKAVKQAYLDMIDEAAAAYNEQVEQYEYLSNLYKHDVNLIGLLYGDDAYEQMNHYYAALKDNSMQELQFMRERVEAARSALDNTDLDEESRKKWTQEWEAAIFALNSTIETATKNIIDKYKNTISGIFDELNKSLTGKKGLEYIGDEWELLNKNSEQYLDNINRAYAVQKLSDKFTDSINSTSSITNQRRLKTVMDEQLGILREKDKLTQYDVDRAEAMYEIALKQMALDEARANKTSMRLRRDSQGNYSYEYVADQDKVAKAQQELAEAQNSLYNMDKDEYKDNLNEIYDIYKEFQTKILDLYKDQTLSVEERLDKEKMLTKQYNELINGLLSENQVVRKNLQESAYLEYAELVNRTENLMMEELVPQWASGVQQMADTFIGGGGLVETTKGAFEEIHAATMNYIRELDEMSIVAGTDLQKLGKDYDDVSKSVQNLIDENGNLVDTYQDRLALTYSTWKNDLDALKNKYDAIKTSAEEALRAALRVYTETQNKNANAADADGPNPGESLTNANDFLNPTFSSSTGTDTTSTRSAAGTNALGSDTGAAADLTTGSKVKFDNGIYFYDSYGTKPFGMKYRGQEVTITKVVDTSKYPDVTKPYHIAKDGLALGWVSEDQLRKFDTGGFTGAWGSEGRVAMLHEKELVLNKEDTANILSAVDLVRDISDILQNMDNHVMSRSNISVPNMTSLLGGSETIEQNVHIEASFPDVRDSREIEQAFNNLVNVAAQRALSNQR